MYLTVLVEDIKEISLCLNMGGMIDSSWLGLGICYLSYVYPYLEWANII